MDKKEIDKKEIEEYMKKVIVTASLIQDKIIELNEKGDVPNDLGFMMDVLLNLLYTYIETISKDVDSKGKWEMYEFLCESIKNFIGLDEE